MIDISVVIVTYKENLDVLKSCFDSVARSENVSFELIVVDNGASDATKGLLSSYEGSKYIRNSKNRGFAAAVNQGILASSGRYVLLLNPDTIFGKDVFARMLTHLDVDGEVGIASCVIRYPDGELQESIRRFPTLKAWLLTLFKAPHILKKIKAIDYYMMRDANPYETQDVESIMGAFMFIRRELIDQIGMLDERYFIWFEEVDYCKMAHDAGWKIRHYSDVQIEHLKGHAFGKIATLKKQKWIRTSLRKYMRKHNGLTPWVILWILTPVFIVLAFLVSIIKPK
ncbi:MAG: glycosyltransferase family 2 protein [Candidatus Uhrbacteria bacterium]|nr:glycosyltransferase family 2 protein [Candidatus Uhrbacteria bacterium]